MPASKARHVRTPTILLNANETPRTVLDLGACSPCIKLLFAHPSTCSFTVGDGTASHADFLAALTCSYILQQPLFLHILVTVDLRTPYQISISIHVNIHLKPDIFLVDLLRAERQYIFLSENFLAPVPLHTWDLFYFAILYVSL